MKVFSKLKFHQTSVYDNDWGFFVEIDLGNDRAPLHLHSVQKHYYKQHYYKQHYYKQYQILPTISEEKQIDIPKKYDNLISIKNVYFVVVIILIFFVLIMHSF